jgi:secreted Zn-dependent insulinase-like peptidase
MDAAAIRDVLKYLAPQNLVVALGAHDFGGGGGGGASVGRGSGGAPTGCIASCACLDKYGAARLRQANACKVEEEPFFGIPINFESFSDAALAAWSAARTKFARVGAAAPSVAAGPLALPIPNIFIAQDFTVKLSGGGGPGRGGVEVGVGAAGNCCGSGGARASGFASCEVAHVPEVVSARQGAVMWHQLEGTQGLFPQPKGVVKCLLETGTPDEVLGAYEQRLWIESVGQVIQTAMYPARAAGLEVGFVPAERAGTVVSFSGFSDKMLGFVRAVLKTAAQFGEDEAAASSAVENARERLLEAVRNSNVSDAYRQAFDTTRRMLVKNAWTLPQAEDALTRATYSRVASFWRRTVGSTLGGGGEGRRRRRGVQEEEEEGRLRAECLFYGNFDASDALALEKAVQEGLRGGKEAAGEAAGVSTAGEDSLSMQPPLPLSEQVALEARAKVGLLPVGHSQVRRINQNGDDGNSGIEVHFALGHGARHLRDEARLVLLGSMIREPAFDQLRTKEQLGYAVFAFKRTILGYTGLSIIVQSPRAKTGDGGAAFLRERVDAFLRDYREVLANVSSTQLVQHKKAAASTLLQRPTDISDAAGRMWAEIEGGDYLFARASTLSVLIDSITPDSLLRFYDTLVMEPATRRRLTVLVSPAPASWPDTPATVGVLTDEGEQFLAWRNSLAAA